MKAGIVRKIYSYYLFSEYLSHTYTNTFTFKAGYGYKHMYICLGIYMGFPVALVVKKLPVNAGDVRDVGSISKLGRSLGGGHWKPLQYSCLENPMDRGAWWAKVHGITKESDTT